MPQQVWPWIAQIGQGRGFGGLVQLKGLGLVGGPVIGKGQQPAGRGRGWRRWRGISAWK